MNNIAGYDGCVITLLEAMMRMGYRCGSGVFLEYGFFLIAPRIGDCERSHINIGG